MTNFEPQRHNRNTVFHIEFYVLLLLCAMFYVVPLQGSYMQILTIIFITLSQDANNNG